MKIRVRLAEFIYPRACVDEAIGAYSGVCDTKVNETTDTGCWLEIMPLGVAAGDGDRAVHEFLNYLLDLSLERRLSESH